MTKVLPYSVRRRGDDPLTDPEELGDEKRPAITERSDGGQPDERLCDLERKDAAVEPQASREHERNRDEKDGTLLTTPLPHVPGTGNEPGNDGDERGVDGRRAIGGSGPHRRQVYSRSRAATAATTAPAAAPSGSASNARITLPGSHTPTQAVATEASVGMAASVTIVRTWLDHRADRGAARRPNPAMSIQPTTPALAPRYSPRHRAQTGSLAPLT